MVTLATVRSILVVTVVVGALGAAGPSTTVGAFSDSHGGFGGLNAANSFNGNNGGITADAGSPYIVYEGDSIQLDGSGSSTEQGNIQSYDWTIVTGGGDLSSASGAQVTYNAPPDVDGETTVYVKLEVTNNNGDTDTDTAEILVEDRDGCGATSLQFCSVTIADKGGGSYDAAYEVEDPAGGAEFDEVRVTLRRNGKARDTATSSTLATTLTVAKNSGKTYTVRVALYDTSGTRVDCTEARNDVADGSGELTTQDCP